MVPISRSSCTAKVVKLVPEPFDGDDWLFEIKHDGFRLLAIRDGASTRLYTSSIRLPPDVVEAMKLTLAGAAA